MPTLRIGQAIEVSDEHRVIHHGLVTAIHAVGIVDGVATWEDDAPYSPSINAVFVSDDPAKRDPYGHQLERLSSVQHESGVQTMPVPGRFWRFI